MSDFGGDLDPLIQKFIIQMDPVQATAFKVATEKAVRAAQAAMAKTATDGTSKAMREVTRITIDATRRRYKQQERLALTAGKREGEIVKQTASNAIAIRKQAASRELDVQRRHGEQRAANEKRAMSKWEEVVRRAFFKMKGRYEESARDQERTQTGSQQRQHRSQQQAYKVWYALFEDFLKRRRARERAQQFEDLAAQKAADRKAWEQQRHRNSRDLTEWREHQRRVTNSHKAMWSIIRSTTETGSRFMSSITQSALRSMGNAVGHGFKLITGQYRQGTNRQEAILRDSYADQTRIVTREIARQQGAVASFQATAQRGALGGFMNLRNLALGFGGYLSASALFGSLVDYEQTQVAFENLLGSAQAAQDMLKDLRAFNVATPFELPQIQQAAKQLLAMGETAAEVIPDLQAIGDVGAKFSASSEDVNGVIRALGQMSQSAKVSAQDINQIQQRFVGFNARAAIARGLGISVAEAMEMIASGAISGNEGMNAMIEGMKSEQNAAGAMEEQMRALGGAISNFTDLLQMLWLDTMVPFLPVLSKAVRTTTMFIDSLAHGRGVWAVVRSGLLGISIALGAIVAQRAAVGIMQLMGTALVNLRLAVVNHPFIAFASVLAVLGTMLYRHNDTFREFVDGFLDRLGDFTDRYASRVADTFRDVADAIGELAAMVMAGEWEEAASFLSDFFTESYNNALAWVRGGGIGKLYDSIVDRIEAAVSGLLESSAVNWLVDFVSASWDSYQEWLDAGGLGDLADSIKWRILDAIVKISDGIKNIDWERFMTPAILGIGAAIVALFVLNLPLWLVAGIAIAISSPRVRKGFEEKVLPKLEEMFKGQNWTPVITALVVGLVAAVALAFTAPGFVVPVLVATAIVGAIAAAMGNPQARKAFKKMGSWLSDKFGEAFSGIDWVEVYGTVLAGIEKVTAKITKWLTLFLTSKEFVTIAAGILLALAGIAGAVIVGFFEGLFKALGQRNDEVYDAITEWLGGLFKDFHPFDKDGALRGVIPDVTWGDVFGPIIDGLKSAWKGLVDGLDPSNWLPKGPSFAAAGNAIWDLMKPGFGYLFEQLNAISFGMLGIGASMADGFVGAFTNLGERILKAIMKGLGSASTFAQDFVNAIIRGINAGLIDKLNDINIGFDPPVGPSFSWTPGLPHIPEVALAKGGIVTKPTVALIGEAGPEAVIPLSGNAAGSIPFTISFDASMIAAQVDAIVSIMAPMGERLVAATTPGMRMWANAVERVLGRILSGFETWGDRMVSLAVSISAAITAGITDGLREGRSEVVRITRGYARSLVGALNPLLTGIGETPIELNFAKGGIAEAHHGAQVHVFNEGRRGRGSSHGEAYIPFDPSNRARSRELAAETARRLGGNVQWFADGGITTPTIQSGQLVPGVTGDVVGLVAEFARRLSTWSLANGGGYHVGSGYRSIEEQTRLYQRYLAGVPGQAPAAPPGRSMHNFGLASDGNHWRNLRPEEFGLRFPMSYEPWHVEPAEGKALLGDTDFPSFQPLPRPPEAGQRGWLSQVAAKLMAYVYDKTLAYAGGLSYSGTAPTLGSASASPAILAAIRQAMGIVGVPASWLGPLLTLISRESSFNPNAYNSILGASGLTQTIPSTFAAYALPGYGGIFNPVANVIAGLRYILARYGTIFNVGQAVSPTPTKGYSYGGIVERDGLYRLAEGNRREAILPLDNPGRTNEILRRLGLLPDDGDQRVTVDSLRPDSAASRNAATLAPVVGEMNVYSNAMDPEVVASLAAAKVNRVVARVRG